MTTILTTRTARWVICRHRCFERNDRQIKTAGGTELQGQLQPLIQIPSPYFFVADEHIEIEQFPPIFSDTSSMNWRPISGRFNIHGWHRPLNWAIEWDTKCGDLLIKIDEPLYYVRFYNKDGSVISNPDLVKISLTEELRSSLNSTAGVTALQRGTASLIRKASEERTGKLLNS